MEEEYCWNCGAELRAEGRFCSDCGTKLDEPHEREPHERDEWSVDHPGQMSETRDDTTLAALAHVLALFTWVLGPLIVFVAADDQFAKENARMALNWQIMFSIYMLVSFVLVFALVGILFVLILPVVDMAFCIIAAIKAADGEVWQYPFTPDIVRSASVSSLERTT